MLEISTQTEEFFLNKETELAKLFTSWNISAFFAHPTYQQQWWKLLGRNKVLRIITFTNQSELVGWASFYSDKAEENWQLVGAKEESDYLDIVIKPGLESDVLAALVSYWHQHQGQWKHLKLESLPHSSQTVLKLPTLITGLGGQLVQTEQDVCPVIALPSSWDAYLQGLDGSFAKRLKRLEKDSGAEDELSYRVLETPEELLKHMPVFIQLHKASGTNKASFWSPDREEFFKNMPAALAAGDPGRVKLYFLDVNNDPAAALLIFDYQNQFLLYNSGFNQYRYGHLGVGTLLVTHTIKEAIALGKNRYDFMRGIEGYKFEFGAVSEPVFDIDITFT